MQQALSRFAFDFADDAFALMNGFCRIVRDVALDGLVAMRGTVMAPIDGIARAADVGHVLDADGRRPRLSREKTLAVLDRRERSRIRSPFAVFRNLSDLS